MCRILYWIHKWMKFKLKLLLLEIHRNRNRMLIRLSLKKLLITRKSTRHNQILNKQAKNHKTNLQLIQRELKRLKKLKLKNSKISSLSTAGVLVMVKNQIMMKQLISGQLCQRSSDKAQKLSWKKLKKLQTYPLKITPTCLDILLQFLAIQILSRRV